MTLGIVQIPCDSTAFLFAHAPVSLVIIKFYAVYIAVLIVILSFQKRLSLINCIHFKLLYLIALCFITELLLLLPVLTFTNVSKC